MSELQGKQTGAPHLVVDVLNHVRHVHLGKRRDEGPVEARLNADDLGDDLCDLGLRSVAVVDNREHGGGDLVVLLRGAGDVLDKIVRLERRRELLARERDELGRGLGCRPRGDRDQRRREVLRVDRVLCEGLGPATESMSGTSPKKLGRQDVQELELLAFISVDLANEASRGD